MRAPADAPFATARVAVAASRSDGSRPRRVRVAAKHPEVLSKVPCFCGCENRGHRHNDDCFVAARDARGRDGVGTARRWLSGLPRRRP